jgi:hypothetical protein
MKNIKFLVKVTRRGASINHYIRSIDRNPITMTTNPKLALTMGRLTAEDAARSVQTTRCISEVVSVKVPA